LSQLTAIYPRLLLVAIGMLLHAQVSSAVLVKDKRWQNKTVLNVVFLDGDTALHQKIIRTAPAWLEKTSLSFQFFDGFENAPDETHIRISFKLQNGSRLGNHQDLLSRHATMNLFDLTSSQISDNGTQRIILHEFGHALGLEHEYRSSNWPYGKTAIQQFVDSCYPKMKRIGHDSESAKSRCAKINQTISAQEAFITAYDERSIMNYPISFTLSSGFNKKIEATHSLSILDKNAVQSWYPILR
jgi:hypothetical protein